MNKFLINGNFLVLNKSIKRSKPNSEGLVKEYYTISLYDKKNDGFEIVPIFDKSIYDRYDLNKNYDISIEVSFYNNMKKLKIV